MSGRLMDIWNYSFRYDRILQQMQECKDTYAIVRRAVEYQLNNLTLILKGTTLSRTYFGKSGTCTGNGLPTSLNSYHF